MRIEIILYFGYRKQIHVDVLTKVKPTDYFDIYILTKGAAPTELQALIILYILQSYRSSGAL
ncbi:hypothetical protein [Chryseobacterium luquanense]|uniref:Uncharacterized protein n=1 Tax=Chryseobacterium luquanense TaxID=2983766 RepID=A0ABT3Y4W4_9FLAO|nr:hypothetical protein [Chryseobacterium luquanense]MCX8533183.1 hypothetical protein [Chryseobacterium luquanense]